MSSNSSSQPAERQRRPFWRRAGLVLAYTAWTFLAFMFVQFVVALLVQSLQLAGVPVEAHSSAAWFIALYNVIVYGSTLVLIVGAPWWIRKSRTTLTDLGLQRPPNWMDLLWLLAGVVAYIILTLVVNVVSRMLFPGADYEQPQEIGFTGVTNQIEFALTFLSLVIIAPVAEEVMFRGYLYGKLKKHTKIWVVIIVTALLFAVAHLQFNIALDTFALGVVLALLRFATGSIWASILLHMLKNGVAFYFLFVNPLVL